MGICSNRYSSRKKFYSIVICLYFTVPKTYLKNFNFCIQENFKKIFEICYSSQANYKTCVNFLSKSLLYLEETY